MNAAEALVRTLVAGGITTCFANPGTSEIHIVAALDRIPEMRSVLGLFEGVVTGAADGYARMTGAPACTLLHLGPGLANGLANLHNARRAQVPVLNIIGDHPEYHLKNDTPLVSDVEGTARPYSHWVRTVRSAERLAFDAVDAIVAARSLNGQIATLIVPSDVAWSEGGGLTALPAIPDPPMPSTAAIERAAQMLRTHLPTALLLDGNALYGEGLKTAGRIAAATGARLFAPYPVTRLERGSGLPMVERVAYVLEQGIEQFGNVRQLILVGAKPPRAYFVYPGKDGSFTSAECEIHTLVQVQEDRRGALQALADTLSLAPSSKMTTATAERPQIVSGPISVSGLASVIGAVLPENAIVVDESMTSGRGIMGATAGAPPHDYLANTGGSIGIAMPLAVGAAVASPDRRVLCLSADGSGMYTLQALWTMARESLNVTTVVFANRSYAVLKREFSYLGVGEPGRKALGMFEIGRPDLDWVHLANGMGVPAQRVHTLEELAKTLRKGLTAEGPMLIEIPL
jgi:acetolactate synthase-1/2/3 large subunit